MCCFQRDVFQNNVFQVCPAVVQTVTPEQPAGSIAKKRKQPTGPYAPAFGGRRILDLYKPLPLTETVELPEQEAAKPESEKPKLQAVSPLLGLGITPKIDGIEIPLSARIENELLADDEDAMIAILVAAAHIA